MSNIKDKGNFFLIGYNAKYPIELNAENFKIHISFDKENFDRINIIKSELEISPETGILTIEKKSNQDDLLNKAQDIKNLLSLALGKSIIFNRQEYWENDKSIIILREMLKINNEGKQIIPDHMINKFIEDTLPNWSKLEKKNKDEIFIIIDYLNQTKHGFIADRILRTMQAWECACNDWTKIIELDTALKDLKTKINIVYKTWREEISYNDIDGTLKNSLNSAFSREIFLSRLNLLIKKAKIDIGKINLDIRTLKDLRDQVAHNGKIKIPGKEAIEYLNPGIMGLQLIILKKLGYKGLVNGVENGWKTTKNISYYFN